MMDFMFCSISQFHGGYKLKQHTMHADATMMMHTQKCWSGNSIFSLRARLKVLNNSIILLTAPDFTGDDEKKSVSQEHLPPNRDRTDEEEKHFIEIYRFLIAYC